MRCYETFWLMTTALTSRPVDVLIMLRSPMG
ncbi:hypothetical protein ACVW19_006876 [Streptomyces sp. TE5632]